MGACFHLVGQFYLSWVPTERAIFWFKFFGNYAIIRVFRALD